jgi:hypothetical protein
MWIGTLPDGTTGSKFKSITENPANIETSMNELYQMPGTISQSFDSHYQSTMMTGVLVAMFGTTVLYFAFLKI